MSNKTRNEDVIKLTRIEDGEMFLFDEYLITSLKGFGNLTIQIDTEINAFGDGDIVVGRRLPSRTIEIDAVCSKYKRDLGGAKQLRERVNTFFDKGFTYELLIDYKGISRKIDCEIQECRQSTGNLYEPQPLILVMKAFNPYFKSVDDFGENIAELQPTFGFPFISPLERVGKETPAGMSFGFFNFDKNVKITNDTNIETFLRAEVTAKDTVENFSLKNGEVEYKFDKTLKGGDVLEIDFEKGYTSLNGVNADKDVNRHSVYFPIHKGDNLVSFNADSGENTIEVKLWYNKLYSSI